MSWMFLSMVSVAAPAVSPCYITSVSLYLIIGTLKRGDGWSILNLNKYIGGGDYFEILGRCGVRQTSRAVKGISEINLLMLRNDNVLRLEGVLLDFTMDFNWKFIELWEVGRFPPISEEDSSSMINNSGTRLSDGSLKTNIGLIFWIVAAKSSLSWVQRLRKPFKELPPSRRFTTPLLKSCKHERTTCWAFSNRGSGRLNSCVSTNSACLRIFSSMLGILSRRH